MRDVSEPSEGAAEEGAIDEVGVVVADKGWGEGERGKNDNQKINGI